MNSVTLTSLRQNLFHLADQVLATGEPLVIERNGRRLVLAPEPRRLALDALPRRDAIIGDPDDLVTVPTWDEGAWSGQQP